MVQESTINVPKVPRLLGTYRKTIVPAIAKEFHYKNLLAVPRLEKIVLNMGIKEGAEDVKILEHLIKDLSLITGQRPVVTRAKKSIAAFKLRQGVPVGLRVTLRGKRMYEFLDRLVNIAMPRIRDFLGFPTTSFDERGNYSFGLQEQTIFPEIELDKVLKTQGMDVSIVMTASKKEEAKRILELFGFPFRK